MYNAIYYICNTKQYAFKTFIFHNRVLRMILYYVMCNNYLSLQASEVIIIAYYTSMQNLLTELNEQLSQQADYCSSLGASSCTLLWRVSQREDCVHSILSGVSLRPPYYRQYIYNSSTSFITKHMCTCITVILILQDKFLVN